MGCADALSADIIPTIKNVTRCLIDELGINRINRSEIFIKIQMLGFDVQYDCMAGMVVDKSAIALVSFSDKIFTLRVPASIGAENRNFRANIVRWLESASSKHVGSHRGGCCFSMHATNNDALFGRHDGGKGVGAPCHGQF